MSNDPANYDHIGHVINLLLEIGDECELVRDDLTHFAGPRLRRLNWKMLPPGPHPWERISSHLEGTFKKGSDSTNRVIVDRQKTLLSFQPDEIHLGLGGFSDYLAYSFKAIGVVTLESIRRDNAIYVFGSDWIGFSGLTKSDIVRGSLQKARIIHTKAWKAAVADLLKE